MLSREDILKILRTIQDPELQNDIVSLGMLKNIEVLDGVVSVRLEIAARSECRNSALKKQIEENLARVPGVSSVKVEIMPALPKGAGISASAPIPGIQNIVAVASGKGGVGKTTVAVNLALAVASFGYRVGLMDGDIYGPNVPLMLGEPGNVRLDVTDDEKMVPLVLHGLKMISMGLLVDPNQPMVWRGPMLHSAVTQFLQRVDWGELDYLFVDLPPGTGDVQLSLVQTVPLSGAVIVTTPQEVALADVRKGIAMFQKSAVPILGVIENMTGDVFGRGGGRKAAEKMGLPFLAEIALDSKIREAGDAGRPIMVSAPESAAAHGFLNAAENVIQSLTQPAGKN